MAKLNSVTNIDLHVGISYFCYSFLFNKLGCHDRSLATKYIYIYTYIDYHNFNPISGSLKDQCVKGYRYKIFNFFFLKYKFLRVVQ